MVYIYSYGLVITTLDLQVVTLLPQELHPRGFAPFWKIKAGSGVGASPFFPEGPGLVSSAQDDVHIGVVV